MFNFHSANLQKKSDMSTIVIFKKTYFTDKQLISKNNSGIKTKMNDYFY